MIRALLLLLLLLGAPRAASAAAADLAGAATDAQSEGKFADAIRLYSDAIKAGGLPPPELSIVYYNRGAAFRSSGDPDKAMDDFNMAIRLVPDFVAAYDSRGNVHREKGELDLAIADYNTALRLKPNYANALDNRGNAYRDKGDLAKAAADYEAALKLRPDDIVAHYNRAHVEAGLERYEAAADDYRAVIALAPSNFYPVLLLHLALRRAGKDDDSEIRNDAERLDRTLWPNPILALYMEQGSAEDALAAASAIGDEKKKQQRLCEADYYIGMNYLLQKSIAKSEKLLRDAARNCPPGFFERSSALVELKKLTP